MIKLVDMLNEIEESFFSSMFGKKTPEPQKQPVKSAAKKPETKALIVDGVPVTAEGISNDGKGYTVWAGNKPLGDMRQFLADKGGSGYGEKDDKVYYYVSDLNDHVNRSAYFTVSAPKDNPESKQVVKKVADQIIKRGKQGNGINTHNLNLG